MNISVICNKGMYTGQCETHVTHNNTAVKQSNVTELNYFQYNIISYAQEN